MIQIDVDAKQLKKLIEATGKAKKKFPRELAAAINTVAKKTKTQVGRDVRKTIALKKDEAERPLSIRGKASEGNLSATVSLKKTKRLGLRHFGARQDKRGVSYKISKNGGRARINGAFQGPKPGVQKMSWKGNAFKRIGKERNPIYKIMGVSAYGAYAKNELAVPQGKEISIELVKQVERRIKLNILRAEGLVAK